MVTTLAEQIFWTSTMPIILVLVIGIVGVIIAIIKIRKPKPAQEKLEHNKEMKGKTLEEYKKDYLAKEKKYLTFDSGNEDSDGNPTKLFLEVQKKINKLIVLKNT